MARSLTVGAGGIVETDVTFLIDEPGSTQVQFLLDKDKASDEPYRKT